MKVEIFKPGDLVKFNKSANNLAWFRIDFIDKGLDKNIYVIKDVSDKRDSKEICYDLVNFTRYPISGLVFEKIGEMPPELTPEQINNILNI